MKILLKSSLLALLLFSFSPAALAGFLDSPLYGNYYGFLPTGKIAVIEVAVGDSSNSLIGTFFFRDGTYGYVSGRVSPDGTVRGSYDYYYGNRKSGRFTANIKKGAMTFVFKGDISAKPIALKAKGQGPDHLAGKYIEFFKDNRFVGSIYFYLGHANNNFDKKEESYTYRKSSATKAVLTVGGYRIYLTYTNPNDDGEGTFTGTGPNGSFSGTFDVSDLYED